MDPAPLDGQGRVWLKGMTRPRLIAWATQTLGARETQAELIWAGLHRQLAPTIAEFATIDADLLRRLAAVARVDALAVDQIHTAADGTRKLALRTDDGALIESVVIPAVQPPRRPSGPDARRPSGPDARPSGPDARPSGPDARPSGPDAPRPGSDGRDHGRATLCVSSQVGCAMNCRFCLTAKMGLTRHLTTAEIIEQLILARRLFPEIWISNVVFMGMGEPLHNLDAVIDATRIMCDDHGLGLSSRRVTVSTSGLIPAIVRFVAESPAQLAVSINATTDAVRDHIMPVNRKYPLADLVAALRALPLRRRERLTLEYVLLADLNDTPADADRLATLVSGLPCKLNLIPFNPHPGSEFRRPTPERVAAFKAALQARHLNTSIRTTRGDERMAACGQLGTAPSPAEAHSENPDAASPRPRIRRPPGLALR